MLVDDINTLESFLSLNLKEVFTPKVSKSSKAMVKMLLLTALNIADNNKIYCQIQIDNLWNMCDPQDPNTLVYFKELNKNRNHMRYLNKIITRLNNALKEIKNA